MTEEELRSRLPAPIAARVQSLKVAEGKVTAILDASGLDAAARESLESATRDTLAQAEGVREVRVATIADRPQRRIVAIGSGKGGVGKSTLTANLAVALARAGHKVGIVDADIYGPSQPRLLDNESERPVAEGDKLVPVASKWGVPVLSMGHLVDPGRAITWRGPMAGRALGQLIDANWGDTDLLLVDLPPGTGDVQITMLQKFKPAGAVIVSTPQDLALIDATRAMQMFEAGGVPVLGLVENMAGYVCPHCGETSDPFGSGGAEAEAESKGIPFLGRIPLALTIREASDAGAPPAASEGGQGDAFRAIADRLAQRLAEGAA
ncbi:Mrp/NBP35 family ATP-binding protein [Pelagerythrobacter marensis]|uniref:Iron-sulfur cluster carrier protein n=1 Tax=Pelagerythrobacter marensis TaxID=543877 RepID=A0A0G3XAW1_9SPHN|nr:Mrp/NBP35 family ATP-binding protein [Pelagerythrobacter marensis]AKM08670.1 ATP-binding protein involved in chromosome partitioning [Pelagerythrobacter marensis]